MPVDLSRKLVIGVSSRALFDLEWADYIYRNYGLREYASYQMAHRNDPLAPGTGFPLIKAILDLNRRFPERRRAEVVIMSRNSPATSLRLFNSIKHHRLDIQRASLSGGAPLSPYLEAFHVDLFLSADEDDVQNAVNAGFAAARIYPVPELTQGHVASEIRIALDGDAVVFSDDAEAIYKEHGLDAFLEHECRNARRPLPAGPFAKLLKALAILQSDNELARKVVRVALVTARNMPAHERVIYTLMAWGIEIDEMHFMGGVEKTKILEAFRPHIFFDDQDVHCAPASKTIPTARVAWKGNAGVKAVDATIVRKQRESDAMRRSRQCEHSRAASRVNRVREARRFG